ncbi:hypothetical protein MB27_12490 [Actinoplanes utahensis]|uniref:Uncharacterized protein n=2 Tax=Actinoplanes utahensis TaxID=1869 RepID=A0A0A6UQD1_ACTUT|nr:hypothetical protein MB27_12490 [Actinoplanes utahensis]
MALRPDGDASPWDPSQRADAGDLMQDEPMSQPDLNPDEYPPIDPREPVPDDAGELLPDTPDELPAAPVEPMPDDGDEGGVREPA